jgi:hypothetical protein
MLAYGVPTLAFLYGERGNAHAHNGDYRSACADYDKALKRAPGNARYLDQRGRAYYGAVLLVSPIPPRPQAAWAVAG